MSGINILCKLLSEIIKKVVLMPPRILFTLISTQINIPLHTGIILPLETTGTRVTRLGTCTEWSTLKFQKFYLRHFTADDVSLMWKRIEHECFLLAQIGSWSWLLARQCSDTKSDEIWVVKVRIWAILKFKMDEITQWSLVGGFQRFWSTYKLHIQGRHGPQSPLLVSLNYSVNSEDIGYQII